MNVTWTDNSQEHLRLSGTFRGRRDEKESLPSLLREPWLGEAIRRALFMKTWWRCQGTKMEKIRAARGRKRGRRLLV